MTTAAGKRFVSGMPWDAVRDALAAGAPAILPIGAGAKQHGFHPPLSTDARQAEWFALQAADLCRGVIWPTLTYGYYPSFDLYSGSISIGEATFQAVVHDIAEALLKQTQAFVLIVNTGISTIEPIKAAVARSRDPQRVLQLDIYRGDRFSRVRDDLMTQKAGSHADEIETSVMLAIDPYAADFLRAVPSPAGRGMSPGKLSPDDGSSPNYSPSGSVGDPRLATSENGRKLVAAILEDIDTAVRNARRTPQFQQ